MSPNKKQQEDINRRMKLTVETKREMIEKREQGMSVADLARMYNRTTSTICTVLKNKDKIKEMDASMGVSRLSTKRLPVLDQVERLLLAWINERRLQGDNLNDNMICEKAKLIYAELTDKSPGSSNEEAAFKGSRGWFEKFKRRTGFDSVPRFDEEARHFVNCDDRSSPNAAIEEVTIKEEPAEVTESPRQINETETKQISSTEIREMLTAWETVATFVHKHHPNKKLAMCAASLFYDNAMSHFYQMAEVSAEAGSLLQLVWN